MYAHCKLNQYFLCFCSVSRFHLKLEGLQNFHFISSTEATTMAANQESTLNLQTTVSTDDVDITEIVTATTHDVDVTVVVNNENNVDDDAEAEMEQIPTMIPTKAGSSCTSFNFIFFIIYAIVMTGSYQ